MSLSRNLVEDKVIVASYLAGMLCLFIYMSATEMISLGLASVRGTKPFPMEPPESTS